MTSMTVHFPAAQGHTLTGRLDMPAGTPRAFALFAHCFTCSKDSKGAVYISQALAARGIAVLRFDFTGLGQSKGEFGGSTFSSNLGDIACAARYLSENHSAPQIVIGHSLGGAAMLAAAERIPEARAIVTVNAPFDPRHVERLITNQEELRDKGEATVDIGGRPFHIRRELLDDLERHNPSKTIGTLRKALLILHTPQDTIVPIDNAAYAAEVIAAWASRYLEKAAAEVVVEGVRVVEAGQGKFAQDVYMGRHRLRADEPVSVGGMNSGPGPYDLLTAALGTCTAMTIRMYADHKQLPLRRVTVDLKHDKVHAADCEECETREGKIDRIDRIITLEGELDDAQRTKLLEIADKCPVHRTLHSEVWVTTRLAEIQTPQIEITGRA